MPTFSIAATPELLVHAIQGAMDCDDPLTAACLSRAVQVHADQIPDGAHFAICQQVIGRRAARAGHPANDADAVWEQLYAESRQALRIGADTPRAAA